MKVHNSPLRSSILKQSTTSHLAQIEEDPEYSDTFILFSKEPGKSSFDKPKSQNNVVAPPRSFQYSTSIPNKPIFKERELITISNTKRKSKLDINSDQDFSKCCVTVFGFSPPQRQAVIKLMEKEGHILEHRWKGKNWMHIHYSQPKEVQNAMKLHGKMMNELGIILGVKSCEDREFYIKSERVKHHIQDDIIDCQVTAVKSFYQKERKGWFRQIIEHILNV